MFDAIILIGLGGEHREPLLAALLMFRLLYHFVPLSIALALFGGVEAWRSLGAKASAMADAENSDWRIELEPDHSRNDQCEANDPNRVGRLAIDQHADEDAADGADPRPYRIRRAEGQRP